MEEKEQFGPSERQTFNLVMTAVAACATTVQVFCRKGFGRRALDYRGGMAAVLLYAVAAFCREASMLYYLAGFLIVLAVQRLTTMRLLRSGVLMHSQYTGYPVLAMKFTRNERTAKGVVEPLLCIFLGIGLAVLGDATHHHLSLVWGGWLALGGFCSSIEFALSDAIHQKRLTDAEDIRIEQQVFLQDLYERGKRR
jgi:drug/metabolite transporter (DMT)-like permease